MGMPIKVHVALIIAGTVSTIAVGSNLSVTESDAIRLYLETSPRAEALPLRVQAVDAELRVDAVTPNPTVTYAVEDAAEVQLNQTHVLTLESRPANLEGEGMVTIRDLVKNTLRMRPDRIIVGEVRGGEALDMLQAMNTGHDGSLTTVHSNAPRDTLARIETMVLMAGMDLPVRAIREQVASALDLIVHIHRLRDGTRRVTHVTEVVGMEGDIITLQDLMLFDYGMGVDENGKYVGHLKATGIRPTFSEHLENYGINLPPELFQPEAFARR